MPTRLLLPVALLPVALLQGLWVRQTVERLPPADGANGSFGTATDGDASISVVGVGDSIIAGVGVERQERALLGNFARRLHERCGRPVHWHAVGLNGADTELVRDRLAPEAPIADIYVVSTGVNDAVRGTQVRRFAHALSTLFDILREKSPRAAILYAGLPPLERFPALPWPLSAVLGARSAQLQSAARAVARDRHALCYDFPPELPTSGFARDGFHPDAAACDTWALRLLEEWLLSPRVDARISDCESASQPA